MPGNYPEITERSKVNFKNPECDTFIYAAYLPPGLHQFIIYCPTTHRAFCKDFVVDLSTSDQYPECPSIFTEEIPKPKITICNVWRKWREDSNEDKRNAFYNDIATTDSFNPEAYIKDAEQMENCKRILLENFDFIKIAYMEMLVKSPKSYPEIGAATFITTITNI